MSEILDPEDLYGPLTTCPECESEFYGAECENCGFWIEDEFIEPDPDEYDVFKRRWLV